MFSRNIRKIILKKNTWHVVHIFISLECVSFWSFTWRKKRNNSKRLLILHAHISLISTFIWKLKEAALHGLGIWAWVLITPGKRWYNKTRDSVGWTCVAHLSFCFEKTYYRTFHRCFPSSFGSLGQAVSRNLVVNIYGRSSKKNSHFIPIR
jgi:hypothetical protein